MFKNYLTVTIRYFVKHKLFSTINILCLSIGITFCLIIAAYVLQQQSVNSKLNDVVQQYCLKSEFKQKDLGRDFTTPSPLAKTLKEEYPSLIKNYFRYSPTTNVVSAGDKHFEEDIAISDTTMITMYHFPLLYGDKNKAFTNNNSAVITSTLAMKLFGTKNALGKTISIQTTVNNAPQDYIVSAVLKDIPYNSVTGMLKDNYGVYVPTTGNNYYKAGDPSLGWNTANELSFIELKPGITPKDLVTPLNNLLKKYTPEATQKNLTINVLPIKDYYLNDNGGAVRKMILILSLVALFILLMVIINFVNINIGTSSYRLKEIGLRKTFGSARSHVILQFIIESLLLTFISTIISIVLYQLLLPVFSNVLNTTLPSFWQFNLKEYGLFILLFGAIGFFAGIYPAFVLSGINLIQAVKGKINSSKGDLSLKRALLVIQFSLAILVFICALNLSRQESYIFNKDLGYNKNHLMVITAYPKQWDSAGVLKMESIKKSLIQLPFVKSATLTYDVPDKQPAGRIIFYRLGSSVNNQLNLPISSADEDYAKTFGIKMKAGTFFSNNKDGIVLNETALKQLGISSANAVGQQIKTPVVPQPVTILGVMKDYNFSTLQDKIGPIGFIYVNDRPVYRYMAVKLNTSNMPLAINEIKARWRSFVPDAPFDYTFMDEKFAALYKSDLQLKSAADIATMLNIIIVLLGIIGVVAFMLTKRNKEIAVRKVLGANTGNIIFIFLKEYGLLIITANIISWPLAYFITERLLQNFAYRIKQNIFPYLIVFAFITVIAFALIALQCFKTAKANPVNSLRTE
jgi:putative ABC transport system permease protein